MNKNILFIVRAAVIAALYVVLTLIAHALGLANYVVQVRFSESLTILPFFTPAAIPGLFVGCILSNFLTGSLPLDILFGSLATLLGALGTFSIGRLWKKYSNTETSLWKQGNFLCFLTPLPPIAANTLVVPFVLAYVYRFEGSVPYFMLTVGIGEVISCGILGLLLQSVLLRYRRYIFE